MQITTATFLLFAAIGVAASPIDAAAPPTDVAASSINTTLKHRQARKQYSGTCTVKNQECCYLNDANKAVYVKCNKTFANKKCTKDGSECSYDDYDGKVECS